VRAVEAEALHGRAGGDGCGSRYVLEHGRRPRSRTRVGRNRPVATSAGRMPSA